MPKNDERILAGKRTRQRILDYIADYTRQFRTAPTLSQIAVHLGWQQQSRSRVSVIVNELIDEGYLTRAEEHRQATLAHPFSKRKYFEEVGE